MSVAAIQGNSAIVGGLACQKDSFLKTLKTVVVGSKQYTLPEKKKGSKEVKYALEFKDTVLFPEGGGQPYDLGTITLQDKKVLQVESVLRDKLTALHITEEPVEVGTEVTLNIDWDRRLDLMQQHTGQHLLSAVLDTYDLETLSWSMNEVINYVDLPKAVEQEVLDEVNEKVNQLILDAIPIEVIIPENKSDHSSNIPDDYDVSKGIIRVVKIGSLDENPCCGTHLKNTGQIQAISVLHQSNIKKGQSRLHFICGSRVYKYLRKQHDILKNIGSELSSPLDDLAEKASQLNTKYKEVQSRETGLLKELANIEATKAFEKFATTDVKLLYNYRPDNNPQYLTLLQKELLTLVNGDKDKRVDLTDKHTYLIINGDYSSGTGGSVKILGPQAETLQSELKNRISELKGGGKGSTFQGKIPKYQKDEIESVLRYLETVN